MNDTTIQKQLAIFQLWMIPFAAAAAALVYFSAQNYRDGVIYSTIFLPLIFNVPWFIVLYRRKCFPDRPIISAIAGAIVLSIILAVSVVMAVVDNPKLGRAFLTGMVAFNTFLVSQIVICLLSIFTKGAQSKK